MPAISMIASSIPDANLILNALMLLAIVGGGLILGPRAWKVAKLRAEIAAKDSVIHTNEQTIEALKVQVATVREDIEGVRLRADTDRGTVVELLAKVAAAEARYDEAMKYTAPAALKEVAEILHERGDLFKNMLAALSHIDTRVTELYELTAQPPTG